MTMQTIRLTDLRDEGLWMMIRIDDGLPYEKSLGLDGEKLRPKEVAPLNRLIEFGVAEKIVGPKGATAYRLTKRGHKLRDNGIVAITPVIAAQ